MKAGGNSFHGFLHAALCGDPDRKCADTDQLAFYYCGRRDSVGLSAASVCICVRLRLCTRGYRLAFFYYCCSLRRQPRIIACRQRERAAASVHAWWQCVRACVRMLSCA
jgi:hypothetical protein